MIDLLVTRTAKKDACPHSVWVRAVAAATTWASKVVHRSYAPGPEICFGVAIHQGLTSYDFPVV